MQYLLLSLLLCGGVTVHAQRRADPGPALRQRMSELQLTAEQKRRIAIIIRRQRMQHAMNQRELDEILTEKQKVLLSKWKKDRFSKSDSVDVKP